MVKFLADVLEEFVPDEIDAYTDTILIITETCYLNPKQRTKFTYSNDIDYAITKGSFYFRTSSQFERGVLIAKVLAKDPSVRVLTPRPEAIRNIIAKANAVFWPKQGLMHEESKVSEARTPAEISPNYKKANETGYFAGPKTVENKPENEVPWSNPRGTPFNSSAVYGKEIPCMPQPPKERNFPGNYSSSAPLPSEAFPAPTGLQQLKRHPAFLNNSSSAGPSIPPPISSSGKVFSLAPQSSEIKVNLPVPSYVSRPQEDKLDIENRRINSLCIEDIEQNASKLLQLREVPYAPVLSSQSPGGVNTYKNPTDPNFSIAYEAPSILMANKNLLEISPFSPFSPFSPQNHSALLPTKIPTNIEQLPPQIPSALNYNKNAKEVQPQLFPPQNSSSFTPIRGLSDSAPASISLKPLNTSVIPPSSINLNKSNFGVNSASGLIGESVNKLNKSPDSLNNNIKGEAPGKIGNIVYDIPHPATVIIPPITEVQNGLIITGKNPQENSIINYCLKSEEFQKIETLKDLFGVVYRNMGKVIEEPGMMNLKMLDTAKNTIKTIVESGYFVIGRSRTSEDLFNGNCWDVELSKNIQYRDKRFK